MEKDKNLLLIKEHLEQESNFFIFYERTEMDWGNSIGICLNIDEDSFANIWVNGQTWINDTIFYTLNPQEKELVSNVMLMQKKRKEVL